MRQMYDWTKDAASPTDHREDPCTSRARHLSGGQACAGVYAAKDRRFLVCLRVCKAAGGRVGVVGSPLLWRSICLTQGERGLVHTGRGRQRTACQGALWSLWSPSDWAQGIDPVLIREEEPAERGERGPYKLCLVLLVERNMIAVPLKWSEGSLLIPYKIELKAAPRYLFAKNNF